LTATIYDVLRAEIRRVGARPHHSLQAATTRFQNKAATANHLQGPASRKHVHVRVPICKVPPR